MYKKITALFFTLALFTALLLPINGKTSAVLKADAATPTVNATDVKLYAMDSWVSKADPNFKIPSNYKGTFQLKVTGASNVKYSVQSGSSVTVSSTGLITPKQETWYWDGNVGTTYPIENPTRVDTSYEYGTSKIKIIADGTTLTVKVEVINYADFYANKVMDDYIASNITSDMSTYDKISKICEFVAHNYDYSAYYSGCTSMIIAGGGDCWASTSTIIKMAKKLGYSAWSRNGNRDAGAGSGHMNALVQDGDKYYECEAGYSGKKPRPYNVTLRESLFSYYSGSDGIHIYQYDGNDSNMKKLEIPESLDGEPVVSLENKFISGMRSVEEVVLPSKLKYIGNYAFSGCTSLKKLVIPSEVNEIEGSAFTECYSLKEGFAVAADNSSYIIENNILYSKDKTVLHSAPSVSGAVTVPSFVTKIGDSAFYYNNGITSIVIPSSVKTIGYQGICDCSALTSVVIEGSNLEAIEKLAFAGNVKMKDFTLPSSLVTIGDYAFTDCLALKTVNIPSSVKTIGEGAYYRCYYLKEVNIDGSNLESIGYGAFLGDNWLFNIRLPRSVTTIEDYAFGYISQSKLTDGFVIMADSDTKAAEYANANNIKLADYNHKHTYTSKVTKQPTCTVAGTKENTCTSCGAVQSELIDAHHDYKITVIAPTYFKDGYTEHRCTKCDDTFKDNYVDKLSIELDTPTDLKVTSVGPRNIDISWKGVSNAEGYVIYYVTDGYTYHYFTDSPINSYSLNWLDPGKTYDIYVGAYVADKDSSEKIYSGNSDKVTASTEIGNVSGFKVSKTNAGAIKLVWNNVKGATGYIVYKEENGKFKKISTPNTNSYIDQDLTAGTAYKYAVKAYFTHLGTTIYSKKYPTIYGVTALSEVTGFKFVKSNLDSITLTWDKYNGANSYTLYRMIGGKWQIIATPTDNAYTDKELTPSTVYKYAVKAKATVNEQNVTSATYPTVQAGTALPEVEGFKATKTSNNTVKLTWNKLDKATGYIVYRLVGRNWKNIGTTTNTEFTDKKLTSITKYTYTIRGYYKVDSTIVKSATYPQITAVTNLDEVKNFVVGKYNAGAIKLAWSKLKGADGYVVYRMVNGKWKRISTTTDINYLDKGLKAGTGYKYAVRAYKKVDGKNIYSCTYPTLTASTAPAAVKFTVTAGKKQATLKWSAVTGATGYIVYYKTSANGSWTKLAATKGKSYTKTGLTSGKTYYFTVKAYRVYGGKTYNAAYTTKSAKIK